MINLSLQELKTITRLNSVKDHKNKSEDELIKILSEIKPKRYFSKLRIEKIRKKYNELRDK